MYAFSMRAGSSTAAARVVSALRAILIVSIPLAVGVVLLAVERETDRARAVAHLTAAWVPALVSGLRTRRAVGFATVVMGFASVIWGAFAAISAQPCGLHGPGILVSRPGCPVQAVHVMSALVGGAAFVAFAIATVGGFLYAMRGDDRGHRVFGTALVLASLLVIAWLLASLALPRRVSGD
jgi:uncharacterized membrane protein YozB (DUF420 family)